MFENEGLCAVNSLIYVPVCKFKKGKSDLAAAEADEAHIKLK